MITRLLTVEDANSIFQLMMKRYIQLTSANGDNSRTMYNIDEQYKLFMDEHMNFKWVDGLPEKANSGRAYGIFKDNELVFIFTQKFSSTRLPTWYVGNMITDPEWNSYYTVATGIAQCLDEAVTEAEKYGYTQFYWVTQTKAWNKREEIWYNASDTFKRYNVFIENIIPAGETSKFDVENMLMGYRTHPVNLAIKSAKIKPQLRHQHFQDRGLLKVDYVNLQEKKVDFKR